MDRKLVASFRDNINTYHQISDISFNRILSIASFERISKNTMFLEQGGIGRYVCFLDFGYMLSYTHDARGKVYCKNIFSAGDWVGSTGSSLLQKPSNFSIKAVTECTICTMPWAGIKDLINNADDIKAFYIKYLERNWVIDKEEREVSIVMDSTRERYEKLLKKHKDIEKHVTLKDIASHLGVTPTQLSRIRKNKS